LPHWAPSSAPPLKIKMANFTKTESHILLMFCFILFLFL
jgi:hypothetical protein